MFWKLLGMIISQGSLVLSGYIIMYKFDLVCSHLTHTGLWVWAEVTLHKLSIVTAYSMLVFVYLFYILPYEEQKEVEGMIIKRGEENSALLDKNSISNQNSSQNHGGNANRSRSQSSEYEQI